MTFCHKALAIQRVLIKLYMRDTITISALETMSTCNFKVGLEMHKFLCYYCVHMYTSLGPNFCTFYSPVYTRPLTQIPIRIKLIWVRVNALIWIAIQVT